MTIAKLFIPEGADSSSVELPEEYLTKLNIMLKNVLEFLNEFNIDYWADGGTLLGCIRDGKHIAWDDDEDLGMDVINFFKFKKHMNLLTERYGYEIRDQPDDIIKIVDNTNCYVRDTKAGTTEPRLACIDIFHYVLLKKDNKFVLSSPKNRALFKGAEYHKSDLLPFKEYQYGDLTIKGAHNPQAYLSSYYGNWTERIVYLYL
jgi:phosphorylcholine metabolism protein LicD